MAVAWLTGWPWGLGREGVAATLALSGGSGDLLTFEQTGSRDGEYWDSADFFFSHGL